MAEASAITGLIRLRGAWASGSRYSRDDIASRGPRSYLALVDHVAGTDSEPGHGSRWTEFWILSTGHIARHGTAAEPAAPIATLAPAPPVVLVTSAAALPAAAQLPAVAPVRPPPALSSPASPPAPLPAQVPAASEIVDDSTEGALSVAFALDALRQHMARLFERIAAIEAAERRPPPSPRELRIAELLRVPPEAVTEQLLARLRDQIRLLRKRDQGVPWSPDDAARWAVLEELDRRLDAIEREEAFSDAALAPGRVAVLPPRAGGRT